MDYQSDNDELIFFNAMGTLLPRAHQLQLTMRDFHNLNSSKWTPPLVSLHVYICTLSSPLCWRDQDEMTFELLGIYRKLEVRHVVLLPHFVLPK